jgi:hypothetical protein
MSQELTIIIIVAVVILFIVLMNNNKDNYVSSVYDDIGSVNDKNCYKSFQELKKECMDYQLKHGYNVDSYQCQKIVDIYMDNCRSFDDSTKNKLVDFIDNNEKYDCSTICHDYSGKINPTAFRKCVQGFPYQCQSYN